MPPTGDMAWAASPMHEAGAVPAGEAVDLNGERSELIPCGDLVDAIGKEGDEADEGVAKGRETRRLNVGEEGVFGNDEAALEIVAAVDKDGEAAVVDVAEASSSPGLRLRRNQRMSMGAPVSWRGRWAEVRVVAWRPSQPMTREALISTGPAGVLAQTPVTRLLVSMRLVASCAP